MASAGVVFPASIIGTVLAVAVIVGSVASWKSAKEG